MGHENGGWMNSDQRAATAERVARYNPTLSDAGILPSDFCACGHVASEHGERLPSPCWHGAPEEARFPKAITAEVMAQLEAGCRCIGFAREGGAK